MSDSHIPGEADALPRRSIDAAAYERRSREGPCFICEVLVAPRIHCEQVRRRQATSRQGHAGGGIGDVGLGTSGGLALAATEV
jgi:hypothetical protein